MKIYDLTATIDTGLWYYGAPYIPYQTKKLATVADNGYITYEHVMTSHTGTHLECAKHWWDEAEGVEQIPLEKVMGKAKVLRIDCGQQALFAIDEKMLADAGGDNLQPGEICIIATGWDRQIREERYIWESPFITVGAAAYLVDKQIRAFAIDAPMFGDPRDGMDYVPAELELPDYLFARHDIPCILGLVNVQELPDEVFFVGAPLKLKGSDGSPVRAFAAAD